MGLSSTRFLFKNIVYFSAGDVAASQASDAKGRESSRVDHIDSRSTNHRSSTCLNASVITAQIHCTETHRDRRIAIQRASFNAFYNAHREDASGASIRDLMIAIYS